MENNEIWMDIPHYEGLYQVSNMGRVVYGFHYVYVASGIQTLNE